MGLKSVALLQHKRNTVHKIIAQGFNRAFSGKNATTYRKGVYFADDFEYSARDICGVHHLAGE